MKNLIILLFATLTLPVGLFAQTPHYLFSRDIEKAAAADTVPWQLQNYAVQLSKIGNYKASLRMQQAFLDKTKAMRNVPDKPAPDSICFASFHPENALHAIARAARKYQVVITNEAHYQPQNRVFATALLKSLYKDGFRYLCVEDQQTDDSIAKAKEDKDLNKRKYPALFTGFYMDEPQYGNLIRTAMTMGYEMVPYEHYGTEKKDPGESFTAREEGQAANIAAIIRKDPKARVFVLCGYGHLNKRINGNAGQMGGLLKLRHHIDPLTIDQQDLLRENNEPVYRWVNISGPIVFKSKKGFFNDPTHYHQVDMVVFFPEIVYRNGRPDWLFYDRSRRYYFVNGLPNGPFPLMVFAYHVGEDRSIAVPADIIEEEGPGDRKALVLNKGRYYLKAVGPDGTLLKQDTIIVK